MKILQLEVGSPEWHAHRATAWNASDAPAMMGCSPYKTRAQLLKERHTGIVPEVDEGTQRLFDAGHRIESLARPIAEDIIGEELYPVVGTDGRLSASFDGLTLGNDVDWECKTLNDDLRAALPAGDVGGPEVGAGLPLVYRVQMEQQLAVSGAGRALFTAARFDYDGNPEDVRHCWYEPDLKLRAQILAGWQQFEADLAAYVPPASAPAVTAASVEHLPALSVKVDGSLAIVSNLQPFGVALRAFVEKIPKKPSTDQEFADTEAACKRLKEAEDRLQQAEDSALASMSDVEEMRRMVADFRGIARTARLASEKMVTARKQQIRDDEIARGRAAVLKHVEDLNERLGERYMPALPCDFAAAIKGLKTIDSLRNAIDTTIANFKVTANEVADRIQVNMKALIAAGDSAAFPDAAALVMKAPDDLRAVIAQRVAEAQQKLEAERERIRAEEAARVERETQERQAAIAAISKTLGEPPHINAELARMREVEAIHAPSPAVQPEQADPEPIEHLSAPVATAKRADEPATLKLGDINARLTPIKLDAAGIAELGISPAKTEGAAKLYTESQFVWLCAALQKHLVEVAQPQPA